jgi:predicted dehydrogenase
MTQRTDTRTRGRNRGANRRQFLKTAAAAAAAPYVITSAALGNQDRAAASERIVMGGIGIGNMGRGDLRAFLGRGDVQYVAVCDVKKGNRDAAKNQIDKHNSNTDCAVYNDFRELVTREDIDAVHCATPDHWHAIIVIEACRNGKDVYCQKPETRTFREGPLMVATARRYGRVVSGGSQRVLQDYRGVVDKCWGGQIGTVKSINVNVGPLPRPCNLPGQPVPEGFDWDMWLGPAPWAPYHPYRCSGSYAINGTSWRSFKDYSGGGMTDWGAHHFGGATFAIDVRDLEPEEVIFHEDNGKNFLTYRYPNGKLLHHNYPGQGNMHVIGTEGEQIEPKPVPGYKGQGGIYGDFIECVKTREKPFRDIEIASHTMAVCHLGLIAYELQRSLKWDQAKQEFPGDEEANRLRDRARREPWVLNV